MSDRRNHLVLLLEQQAAMSENGRCDIGVETLFDILAEIRVLEQAIVNMECSCLPYTSLTGEGLCQRCEALRK